MKMPEEIKRVLSECDEGYACKRIKCPYDDGNSLCNGSRCMADARKDSLAYIRQLESKLANMTEDFANFANAGIYNRAPFCENKTPVCANSYGRCIDSLCDGFVPKVRDE